MSLGHLYVFIRKLSIFVFCPFFNWIFSLFNCMSCFYILEIKPLLITSFTSIFSQSVGCPFILFMVSFAMPKLISLTGFHLFIFAFVSIALEDWPSKKIIVRFMSENVLCRSFMVSCLIFKFFKPFWVCVWYEGLF